MHKPSHPLVTTLVAVGLVLSLLPPLPAAAAAGRGVPRAAVAPPVAAPAPAAAPAPRLRAAAVRFPDTAGLWDAADVDLLARAGIVSGEPSGAFNPLGQLTRAQLAALLTRTLDLPPGPPAGLRDVPPHYWAASVVDAVYRAGIMRGVGHGMFLPGAPVTRAQAVTALARALHLNTAAGGLLPFKDAASIPAWAAPSIAASVAAHLVEGLPDGTFRPNVTLNRAEAAHLFAEVFRRIHHVAVPGGVRLTNYRDHADVAWLASGGATAYEVERRAPGGLWRVVGRTTDRVWGDYHADPTTAYSYRVIGVGVDGLTSRPSSAVTEPDLTPLQQSWVKPDHFSVATWIGLRNAVAGGPGAVFGLGGLRLKGLPAAGVRSSRGNGPTELFSDSPETATRSEILYRDTASGRLRLYYDHVNGTGGPAHFVVYLSDKGAQPVNYQFYSYSEATSGGPKAEGEKVAATLLAPPQPILSTGTIQPGGFIELDPYAAQITLPAGDGVQGSYDVFVSAPTQVTFAMVAASLGDPYTVFAQHRLPVADPTSAGGDGAGRGTFADATRNLSLTFDPARISSFLLGDGTSDPFISGRDAMTGRPATLQGNYGVVYRLTGTPKARTALVAVPIGGGYYGAIAAGGKVFAAPRYVVPSDGSTGFLLGVWQAGRKNEIDWVPPAGSFLPLQVLAIPLGQ